MTASPLVSEQSGAPKGTGRSQRGLSGSAAVCEVPTLGSPYIPVDSWVYPAVLRLYSMGYIDHVYLGMRPWTRASVSNMLEDVDAQIEDANNYGVSTVDEAQSIYSALTRFLHYDVAMQCLTQQSNAHIESVYSAIRGISGTSLRDSFHLGSTIINDYGRPYENGINNYSGASGFATFGRFTLYARGEFQGAPSAAGYPLALAQVLSSVDETTYTDPTTQVTNYFLPQTTIPMGPIGTTTNGRFLEAYVSAHLLNHEISFGKQDNWLGPGLGGGMAYSNNAENIYSFRINRVEPLYIPLLSRITGPFRYDFLVGSLRGHDYIPNPAYEANPLPTLQNVINPGDAWVHVEKISLRPTNNLEFGFERTVIWGGKGHAPITIASFLRSFFSFASPTGVGVKTGRTDPGARFGAFDFSYRLPFLRNWLTIYSDAEAHDDVSPIDNPPRGCYRPGLYLSHVPRIPKLDVRVEAVDTDSSTNESQGGLFQYWENLQRQGYTNQGQLFGDWIGREDKGGQGWITYHLSGNEWLQVGARNQKAAKDFIPGGTTLNDINFQAVKRIAKDLEINGSFTFEHWKAPVYLPGRQTVTTTTIQLTWLPDRKVNF
ncbi:MAG: capsule assembly Wzi family protein [Terracidiphilus sp.]|jgi:hypothetical protein